MQWDLYLTRPSTLLGTSIWYAWYSSEFFDTAFGMHITDALFIEQEQGGVRYYWSQDETNAFLNAVSKGPEKIKEWKALLARGQELNTKAQHCIEQGPGAFPNYRDAVDFLNDLAFHATVFPHLTVNITGELLKDKEYASTVAELKKVSFYPPFLEKVVVPLVEHYLVEHNIDPAGATLLTLNELDTKAFDRVEGRLTRHESGERFMYEVHPGKELVTFTADIQKVIESIEGKPEAATCLTGTVACKGKVRGRVRIAQTNDPAAVTFAPGDVLVAPSTSPTLMPLMSICSAIITDEGGAMCHAAIVSRELKKPCIIGTKNATKLLSDGDLVEVDAEKGEVRLV